ncbi:MAG: sigma-70 family RNA polymerase sigma factor [Chloroflexota bacterium]
MMDSLEILVTQAQSGHCNQAERQAAFERLVKHFQNMAIASAFALLQDKHLAQDVTQEAFITAYQKLDQLRDPKAFPSWLHRIVLTQCHRQKRGKRVTVTPIESDDDIPVFELDPAVQLEKYELQRNILNAIDDLPEHEKDVVRLFYLQGYAIKEISRQLNLPVTTIKKRLQYARRRLRHTVASTLGLQMMVCYPGGSKSLNQLLEAILNQLKTSQLNHQTPTSSVAVIVPL